MEKKLGFAVGVTMEIKFPDKKYQLIYADPAWKYWSGGSRSADRHYPTMNIEDIKDLPVQDISEKDSILAMWVTNPILPQALEVVKAWGFEYSTVLFTWIKRNKVSNTFFWGCGSYTRANPEMVIIGRRGKGLPVKSHRVHSIIEAPLDQKFHSKKPDIVRSKLLQLFGDVTRIELNARQKIFGWDVWGNDPKLNAVPLESFSHQLIQKELLLD